MFSKIFQIEIKYKNLEQKLSTYLKTIKQYAVLV